MSRAGITFLEYTDEKSFMEKHFLHRDARIMDRFTMIAVETAQKLYKKAKCELIPSERLGVVLATKTGSYTANIEFHNVIHEKGYVGVNPSKFPNIMLSTPLSRITTAIQAKGPSVPMFITDRSCQAIDYSVTQIEKGVCDCFIIIYANEGAGCFGLLVETGGFANQRGVKTRFEIQENKL